MTDRVRTASRATACWRCQEIARWIVRRRDDRRAHTEARRPEPAR